jgi:hypothetical protein
LLPATGQAATVFGSRLNHDPVSGGECKELGIPCTLVSFIVPTDPNGDPYAGGAPVDGVITKFRIRADAPAPTQVTFRLANISRPNPGDEDNAVATGAGTGPTLTIQPSEGPEVPIQEIGGRLPVKKGQHLAIDATDVLATETNGGNKFTYVFTPALTNGGSLQASLEPTGELLVQGVIEPDADGDGFGDETQDQCPTQKSTQGPCDTTPPGVNGLKVNGSTISYSLSEAATVSFQLEKKAKGRKVGGKCVKQTAGNKKKKACPLFKKIGARFNGPGATGANTATLPNGKKLKPGTYRLTMTAADVAGNTTTKTITFKVKKKKKK